MTAASVNTYIALLAAEHVDKPKFVATVTGLVQPMVDLINLLQSIPDKFDLDLAVGVQLDIVGLWVGVTRFVSVAIPNVFFSFDTENLGFDQGTWFAPGDSTSGLVTLPDDAYRTLLRARIANNQWDGTIPSAYAIFDALFAGTGQNILIQDLGGMHMLLALTGPIPDALTKAMFVSGLLNVKPAGVRIDKYVTPTVPSTPFFGFDVQNSSIAGFDTGAWGELTAGT